MGGIGIMSSSESGGGGPPEEGRGPQAFATQLSGIDKINIIDMGGGGPGGGMGKAMATVGGGMTAMFGMLKDQFGIDVAQLMEAKPEPVAQVASSEVAHEKSEAPRKIVREYPLAQNGSSRT